VSTATSASTPPARKDPGPADSGSRSEPERCRVVLPLLPGALCKGQDPSLWFPLRGGSMDPAKAVCRDCPARVGCLDWAVQADERAGVWGGISPDERAQLRRKHGTGGNR
jgi:WhiB family transcriptional regulator, redox-sensing transcriptional regulator